MRSAPRQPRGSTGWELARAVARFRRAAPRMFAFCEHADVAPTNNAAGRTLRHVIVRRLGQAHVNPPDVLPHMEGRGLGDHARSPGADLILHSRTQGARKNPAKSHQSPKTTKKIQTYTHMTTRHAHRERARPKTHRITLPRLTAAQEQAGHGTRQCSAGTHGGTTQGQTISRIHQARRPRRRTAQGQERVPRSPVAAGDSA